MVGYTLSKALIEWFAWQKGQKHKWWSIESNDRGALLKRSTRSSHKKTLLFVPIYWFYRRLSWKKEEVIYIFYNYMNSPNKKTREFLYNGNRRNIFIAHQTDLFGVKTKPAWKLSLTISIYQYLLCSIADKLIDFILISSL